jgi:hypothetical protein
LLIDSIAMYLRDSILQEQSKVYLRSAMKNVLNGTTPEDYLIPEFSVGCKRVIPSGFRYLKVSASAITKVQILMGKRLYRRIM